MMRLVESHSEKEKKVYVYEDGNYEFEFWEIDGEVIGPRIGAKHYNEVSDKLANEAKKLYPHYKGKIYFSPVEIRML